jgi:SAM-dependent methyltransferase
MTFWDDAATNYESEFEAITRFFMPNFVDWVSPTTETTVVDVATGPGVIALAMAGAGASVKASDLSPAMVAVLDQRAAEAGCGDRIETAVADAQALPYPDDSADAAVSSFGVIFCPDVERGLGELARVTKPGGRLMISAWTTPERNGWTALMPADVESALGFALPPRPAYRWPDADALRAACARSGWSNVDIETKETQSTFASWQTVAETLESPPTRAGLASLTDEQRDQIRQLLEQRAREMFGEGEVALPREAWLARGIA